MTDVPHRVAIMQRVLPPYRAPLFDALAERCNGLSVFAGQPAKWETLETTEHLDVALMEPAVNRHIFRGRFAMYRQAGLVEWLESWDPDVLVAEANPRGMSTGVAIRWMHDRARPVLGWGMGAYSVTGGFSRLRERRRRRFLSSFDVMLAYSSRGASQYREVGFPTDRVFVCHNATTFRPALPPPRRPPSFANAPVILFVGRLTDSKRVDVLVRACAQVAATHPDLAPDLRIVGAGEAMPSLQRLAARAYPRTRFLGALRGIPLNDQFAAADLFVLPNLGGLAIQEAMSHALPVIVGEADGTQEDLVRSDNGWQVRRGVDTLAEAIYVALRDPAKLRAMGSNAFRIVAEEINLENMVDAFLRAINVALEHARPVAEQ